MPRLNIARSGTDRDHSHFTVAAACDLSSSVAELAEELLAHDAPSLSSAERALQQLRRRARATDVTLWALEDGSARRVASAGRHVAHAPSLVDLRQGGIAIDRLQSAGTLVCRYGEVAGVEELVPEGVRSFVAAGATSKGALVGVLVLGWSNAMPKWSGTCLRDVRVVAGLLARMALGPDRGSRDAGLADAILGALSDRIAVVDRNGIIVRVNAAWTEFARQQGVRDPGTVNPGADYLHVCRTAAANGSVSAAEAAAGLEAVLGGSSKLFEAVYACHSPAEERWCTMVVTPLGAPGGGAVVAHADITRGRATVLEQGYGERLFHRLADAVPVPLCVLGADGHLLSLNQRWAEAAGCPGGNGRAILEWTDAFHPADRKRAVAALDSAVARQEGFHIELRLNASDASFRWSACAGSPLYASDGRLERLVVFALDTTAKRRAEASVARLASRLVAAQEDERSRIARELHDDLGQQLALLAARLQLATRGDGSTRRASAALQDAFNSVHDLATSVHNLSHELHPAKLKLLGLGPTLDSLCRTASAESGVPITCERTGIPADVSEEAALCAFRVTQEALHNAVRHSMAPHIAVTVRWEAPHLILRIADDGAGFDPLVSHTAGIGLLTMRERVELLGGRLTIETAKGRGTTIEAAIPLAQGRPAAARRMPHSPEAT